MSMKPGTLAILIFLLVIIIALLLWIGNFLYAPDNAPSDSQASTTMNTLKLTSHAFDNNGTIPTVYTCKGTNVSPPLSISGVPDDTAALAITLEDPDAPSGTFDHWVAFNIDKDTREIPEGQEPHGTPGKNSAGKSGYTGPCPPSGVHRYVFTVYALDSLLDIPAGSSKADVVRAMNGHILAQSVLIGRFGAQ
jgi:Raf kinase inhibitor-like YbhB/YbcL family protein